MRVRRSRLGIAAVAALCFTLVAACGSGGASSTAANLTGPPITVGVLVAKTGFTGSSSGPTADVAEAWAEWTNAHGGIGGHPVAVHVEDTAGTPATAQSGARKLVETDKVAAIIVEDAASEGAIAPYLQQANVPVVGALGFSPAVWGKLPNFFTMTHTSAQTQEVYPVGAQVLNATKDGTAVCAEVASCAETAKVVANTTAPKLGQQVVAGATLSSSAPNYTAECLNYIEKGTEAIIAGVTNVVLQRLIADCNQQGYQGGYVVAAGTVIERDLETLPGIKFGGTLPSFPWWVDAQPVNDFRDAMEQYASDVDIRSSYVTSMWAALALFGKAVSANPDNVTPATVFDAYYGLKGETLGGLLPQPVTYTRGQPAPTVTCYWPFSYTAGDENPKLVQMGASGNDAQGDLSSSCLPH